VNLRNSVHNLYKRIGSLLRNPKSSIEKCPVPVFERGPYQVGVERALSKIYLALLQSGKNHEEIVSALQKIPHRIKDPKVKWFVEQELFT